MSYKKYIERNGKLYGPYIYSSKRVDGKVISEYQGTGSKNHKKFLWIFLGVFLIAGIFYLLFFNGGISGKVVLGIDATYEESKPLKGTLNLVLKEGELIPASSKVVFENSGQNYEFFLKDIIKDSSVKGDFYIEGTSISGEGEGYGIEGEKTIYPEVEFTLLIYKESNSNEEPAEEGSEETPIDNPPEQTEEIPTEESQETPMVEETPIVEETITEETKSAPITGTAIGGLGRIFKLTGRVSMDLEEEMQGGVSKDNPFIYELKEGETAELKPKSVKINSEELKDNDISFKIEENKVVVTTDYSEKVKSYGQGYVGNNEEKISIDLSELNLFFEKGELIVKIVYEEEEILSLSTILEEKKPVSNETILEIPELNETVIEINETANKTFKNNSIEDISISLTEKEREILMSSFGNSSINTIKTESFKDKIIVYYNFSNYTIEFSYDSSLKEEDLKIQMEKDRIQWMKDIANSLLYEKTVPTSIEGFNNTYSF
ncbi:MAG: hypothetical protein ABIE36_03315 [Candidatus Diapherotrites archaeon]